MYPVFPPTNLTRITLLPFAVDRHNAPFVLAYSPVPVRPLFISALSSPSNSIPPVAVTQQVMQGQKEVSCYIFISCFLERRGIGTDTRCLL
jgi:hypothetical protein